MVKELERGAKPLGVPKNAAPKPRAIRRPRRVHITEDEADILISMRREKEKRVSLAEVLRKHGYGLER
jgi:hypothetical protein